MSYTYKDIAKKSGVSITTVSRVINKKDLHKVGKKKQEKVEAIIKRLDFTPNIIARSLVSKKTFNIAVAIKDLEDIINPYFSQVVSGIASVLERRGYYLQLVRTLSEKEPPLSPYYLKAIQEKRVDGLILLSEEAGDREVVELYRKKVPLVLVNRYIDGEKIPSVLIDNEKGLYDATKALIELGRKKIVFMAGALKFQLDRDRLNGYKKALSESNIDFDESLVLEGLFEFDKASAALEKLLAQKKEFNAIAASDDVMALACITALKKKGISVPGDVSVIGFNDMMLVPVSSPTLSSMRLPLVGIGKEAANMILKLIDKEKLEKAVVTFTPELIKRESTGSSGAVG
ncbi:MAG: LacI family DNA-binding transcriptional regulator [Candidatus Omnitrophota bacterium]|nr:LacI family DNA-binding transcriptional regulator [Candidatus Omnitrophota bacterium]